MKKLIFIALILATTFGVGRYAYVQAYGIRLSPAAFVGKAGAKDSSGSMYLLRYDGYRNGRAYLESWEMNRLPRTILYWTELDGLSADTKNEIQRGLGRWKVESR